jgi:hypothetical protein
LNCPAPRGDRVHTVRTAQHRRLLVGRASVELRI